MPLQLIDNFTQIKANISQFNIDLVTQHGLQKRLSAHTAWYYNPETAELAPSKFIGFIGMTVEKYLAADGKSFDGGRTENALHPYFDLVPTQDNRHSILNQKLKVLLKRYNKLPRSNVRFNVPKQQYLNKHEHVSAWSKQEDIDTVDSYIAMLSLELNNLEYNKTTFRNNLLAKLNDRTPGAVERKHQNISSILIDLGLPYIKGYKPLGNYQKTLRYVVEDYFSKHGHQMESTLEKAAQQIPNSLLQEIKLDDIFIKRPPGKVKNIETQHLGKPSTHAVMDYVTKELNNRKLGDLGEQFVVRIEKARLVDINRPDLAEKVEWVSKSKGDGLGYDILSYDESGKDLYIEVKTTNQTQYSPFIISANELAVSQDLSDSYRIYRVINFSTRPQIFILNGYIKKNCNLSPLSYKANI